MPIIDFLQPAENKVLLILFVQPSRLYNSPLKNSIGFSAKSLLPNIREPL